ncbi:thiamine phosphate synthase [Catellatospora tritici]|uniref:thiamine phosphate synthase n=1 Tax=Catellatospora tritici TaxID=2851566 RepID=UPI001C2D2955|nr:thiamine phosphate synthase [Catellatospora tritici]MBV1849777.1 thiamine phosphate synthase [Catellatospora tritici]
MGLGRLHLVTDSRPGRDPVAIVRAALSVATPDLVIQFRPADDWTDRYCYDLAGQIVALCRTHGVPVLVNDRLHVGVAAGAAGGHVGADDLPVAAARRLLGPGAILGATARLPATALRAVGDGADYLGVGPCYATYTKDDLPVSIGPEGLRAVARQCADTPIIAIGGVTAARVPDLLAVGAHGVAVIGAVSDAPDPARAVAELLAAVAARP